ncbi:bacteriocin fulvocin C-related protein [Streptomyces sp. NPDC020742]|uniref:bacteriocin fulvocin C-related protein n=1 Tax=Streptomyces sp. NPDC020742 TaxID=3154897 RepID=UPI0033E124E1
MQQRTEPKVLGRKSFLRISAGAAVAGGLLLTGKTPAFAQERQTAAEAWVTANRHNLPQSYRSITTYSLEYRREIYRALPPATRGKLWREHLDQYRAAHPNLTQEQQIVLDRLQERFSDDSTFDSEQAARPSVRHEINELQESVIAAFGQEEAYTVVGVLGPPRERSRDYGAAAPRCYCHAGSIIDSCSSGDFCYSGASCVTTNSGCGFAWREKCNGLCYPW